MIRAHSLVEAIKRGSIRGAYTSTPPEEYFRQQRISQLEQIADEIATAEKFDFSGAIPEHLPFNKAHPLTQTGIEYLAAGLLKLPFDGCYFEFSLGLGMTIGFFAFPNEAPVVGSFVRSDNRETEETIESGALMYESFAHTSGNWIDLGISAGINDKAEILIGACFPDRCYTTTSFGDLTLARDLVGNIGLQLIAMLVMLDAKGTSIIREPAPERLNKKRAEKGRPPISAHHIVKIGGVSHSGRLIPFGHQQASPRQHWRRGHLRHLPQKIVPVRACLVGDDSLGKVTHDYEIAR